MQYHDIVSRGPQKPKFGYFTQECGLQRRLQSLRTETCRPAQKLGT